MPHCAAFNLTTLQKKLNLAILVVYGNLQFSALVLPMFRMSLCNYKLSLVQCCDCVLSPISNLVFSRLNFKVSLGPAPLAGGSSLKPPTGRYFSHYLPALRRTAYPYP